MKPELCFVHIPKCGGSTMRAWLQNYFPREDSYEVDRKRPAYYPPYTQNGNGDKGPDRVYRYYYGHTPLEAMPVADATNVIVLLRHPAYRIVSDYYQLKRVKREHFTPPHKYDELQHVTLDGFIRGDLRVPTTTDNAMVRWLCGWDLIDHGRSVTRDDYERARVNLLDDRVLVGRVEDFDAFTHRVVAVMGWRKRFDYRVIHQGTNYDMRHIPDDVLTMATAYNRWDMELYTALLNGEFDHA